LDDTLGPPVKSGFTVTFASGPLGAVATALATCNGAAAGSVLADYLAVADPVSWGTSGNRHFGTSEAQTIFQNTADAPFTAISSSGVPAPPIGATVSPIK